MMVYDLIPDSWVSPDPNLRYYHGPGIRRVFFALAIALFFLAPLFTQSEVETVYSPVVIFFMVTTIASSIYLSPARLTSSYVALAIGVLGFVVFEVWAFIMYVPEASIVNGTRIFFGLGFLWAAYLAFKNILNYQTGDINLEKIVLEEELEAEALDPQSPSQILSEERRERNFTASRRESHLSGD